VLFFVDTVLFGVLGWLYFLEIYDPNLLLFLFGG